MYMRTSRIPLSKIGVFSSKAMDIWMIVVVVFLVMILNIPFFIEYLKLASVDIVPVISIAWLAILAAS